MEGYWWICVLLLPLPRLGLGQHATRGVEANQRKQRSIRDGLHDLMRLQCPRGFFGYRCRFQCRCLDNAECNKVTGTCPRGCARGFWGPGCQLSNQCFYNGQQRNYMGTINVTEQGTPCQAWARQFPHDHTYKTADFPDGRFPDNFCRTTPDSNQPWCYSLGRGKRWQYCRVSNCACPRGLFGPNCGKMCHCRDQNEACDSALGMCTSGCDLGWTGYDCQTPIRCRSNTYGWACESRCQCRNDRHCTRFTGPSAQCQCKDGFFNAPQCEPVTKPRIVDFVTEKVNPGQPAVFNCTVTAFPLPRANEIRLQVPDGRQAALTHSVEMPGYGPYTRRNTFRVSYVQSGERYQCVVQGTAGVTNKIIYAQVYELPRMDAPPTVARGSITASEAVVEWRRWDPDLGDPGDPDILWYSVWIRAAGEREFDLAGIVYHSVCRAGKCRFGLTGLQPNSRYSVYVSVRRDGEGGEGPPGPVIHLTTNCAAPSQPPMIETLTSALQHNTSVPLTLVTVTWQTPPRETLHCNHIAKYVLQLSPPPDLGPPRTWDVAPSSGRALTLPTLRPDTDYCVTLHLVTDAGYRSPESAEKCIRTPPTLPPPPSKLKEVSTGSTTVTFSWNRPDPSYGNITRYRILYWQRSPAGATVLEWSADTRYVEYTLTGLQAFTTYQIQVQAVNAAGAGQASSVLTVTTLEDVPGPVQNLRNLSRTESTIQLQWSRPLSLGGRLLHYTVDCEPQKSLPGGQAARPPTEELGIGSEKLTVRHLSPATHYQCTVRAHTARGAGLPASLMVWTLPTDPRQPVAPVLRSVTDTTVTLDIHHSGDLTVSFYRLIVERLDADESGATSRTTGPGNRRKRDAPLEQLDVSFAAAQRLGLPAYVTAQLARQRVGGAFTVGDNRTYEGYFNAPLERDTAYDIWLVAFSDVDGTLRESFAKTKSPVIVRALTAPPPASHGHLIVIILIMFVLLVLVFAVLLFAWRRRRVRSQQREKAELPSFGAPIFPEPDTSPPPTPVSEGLCLYSTLDACSTEAEPLLEATSLCAAERDPIYSNAGSSAAMGTIRVEDLWDYIRNAKSRDMDGLKREYRMLPAGLTASCEAARREENKMKNRYGNIIAYDHTRVILDIDDDDSPDDYINANYIDGYKRPRAYIAAQGPNPPTIKDLWRMIWKENSKTLIMLTNLTETGKVKCEQYWPEEGCEQYGPISVQFLNSDELPDFTIRTFLLTKGGQSKYVKQFHFTTWPDHGVPRFGHSLLLFRQKIRAYDNLDSGPVVIHCSAGVGRTGTYIAVDTQLERARAEGVLNVQTFVQLMRTQRVNMVQSFEQYVFVYDSLLEALICGDTTVSSHAFPQVFNDLCIFDADIGKTKLEEQFEILKLLSTTIERDESTTALLPDNIFKNRCKNIVPANRCRPYLMTPSDGSNDYINAVFLNSYTQRDGLVVTQMPLPDTVTDFWRLIHDHNCHTIVMLNDIDYTDDTVGQYWQEGQFASSHGPFEVQTTARIHSDPTVTLRDFTLTNTAIADATPRVVRQFHFHCWAEGAAAPASGRAFLDLVQGVETWYHHTGCLPIAVHCMNGASRSGLLCAVLYILERLRKDKEVDVFQAVKQMRLNRTQFIDTLEQYKFCHEILLEFLSNPDRPSVLT